MFLLMERSLATPLYNNTAPAAHPGIAKAYFMGNRAGFHKAVSRVGLTSDELTIRERNA